MDIRQLLHAIFELDLRYQIAGKVQKALMYSKDGALEKSRTSYSATGDEGWSLVAKDVLMYGCMYVCIYVCIYVMYMIMYM